MPAQERATNLGMTSRASVGLMLAIGSFFAATAGWGIAIRSDFATIVAEQKNMSATMNRVERALEINTQATVRGDRDQAVMRAEMVAFEARLQLIEKRIGALEVFNKR